MPSATFLGIKYPEIIAVQPSTSALAPNTPETPATALHKPIVAGMETQFALLKEKAFESFRHGTALSMQMIMVVAFAAALTIFIFAPKKTHEVD
ncbi:MAG: hypothetical protein ACOYK4_06835 [Candidatus Planktophila sp.]